MGLSVNFFPFFSPITRRRRGRRGGGSIPSVEVINVLGSWIRRAIWMEHGSSASPSLPSPWSPFFRPRWLPRSPRLLRSVYCSQAESSTGKKEERGRTEKAPSPTGWIDECTSKRSGSEDEEIRGEGGGIRRRKRGQS